MHSHDAEPQGGKLVFVIAGEPSGDTIGARLMAALRRRAGPGLRFVGIGGEAMAAEGLRSLFPFSELSVMGLVEVLPRAPALLRRMRETAAEIHRLAPAAVVSVDAPAFCFGVWKRLGGDRPPLIHYVAPTVWAWRPGRARKYARTIDHLMALLPFEPPFFEAEGLACSFVGHPVLESGADAGDGDGFRRRHGLTGEGPLLCLLPGSRRGEAARLLPPFGAAVGRLRRRFPGLRVVIPTVPTLADTIARRCAEWETPCLVVRDTSEKFHAMAACDAALAASGTVTLELALAGIPMVVAYRLHPLTAAIVKRMVRVEYANLINLLLDRPAIPELLQAECRPDRLAAEIVRLLEDEAVRRAQAAAGAEAMEMLRPGAALPSECAAQTVLDLIARPRAQPM